MNRSKTHIKSHNGAKKKSQGKSIYDFYISFYTIWWFKWFLYIFFSFSVIHLLYIQFLSMLSCSFIFCFFHLSTYKSRLHFRKCFFFSFSLLKPVVCCVLCMFFRLKGFQGDIWKFYYIVIYFCVFINLFMLLLPFLCYIKTLYTKIFCNNIWM